MPAPSNNPDKITYFAETDYRSKRIKFGIRDDDRGKHMYVIGKTGMGKSTLLENLAIQDIQNGEGVCFIDPHGGTAETLLSYVPEHRIKDVIYFAPFDQEFPVGLNVMEDMGRDKRPLVVSGLMGAFKKVWVDAWSARMEYILNNAMLALMETPGSTLLGVNRMFADKDYRAMIVAGVTDPSVKAFWIDEYAKYSDKFATEATAAIQNKVGQFAANPLIRNLIGQPQSTFDIRQAMDERKIFIVNLSKGRMGEGNANLVGSMLITKIYLAAMSRADVGPELVKELPPFYLYVDEFQSFANESFADILSEARKYKLSLTIAHQYIEQMSDEVRAAVFGNVGTMISFRVGSYDAEVLEKEFAPAFLAEDIVNLGFAQIYLKLMIKGIGSPPFSAQTLNRPKMPTINFEKQVIDSSRAQFALPRAQVEEEIRKWHEPVPAQPRDPNAPPETKKYPPGARPNRIVVPTFTPSAQAGQILPVEPSGNNSLPTQLEVDNSATKNTPAQFSRSEEKQTEKIGATPPLVSVATQVGDAQDVEIKKMSVPIAQAGEGMIQEVKQVENPHVPQFKQNEIISDDNDFVLHSERVLPQSHVAPQSSAPTIVVPKSPRPVQNIEPIHKEVVSPQLTPANTEFSVPKIDRRQDARLRDNSPSPTVYKPFKNQFSKSGTPSISTAASVAVPQKFVSSGGPQKSSVEKSAPLSILKSQPKKDKGPSEENMTSLKEALLAAMATNKQKEMAEEKKPEKDSITPSAAIIQEPVDFTETKKENYARPELKTEFLNSRYSATTPTEVPEDVLRNVLAD